MKANLFKRRPAARAARPATAAKLSHLVADALRARIGSGELSPGDGLPSESKLLQHFEVSRPTLREALRVVESEGLIALGRGARTGATVLGPSVEAAVRYGEMYLAAQKTTLGDVHQVRTMLEPAWVAVLATRPRPELVKALRVCVAAQRSAQAEGDLVATVSALNQFHRRMVEFSENRALSLFAGILEGIPNNVYYRFLQAGDSPTHRSFQRRTAQSVEAHAKLVELIAAGKAARARTFWRAYQDATGRYLERAGLARMRVQMPPPPF
jgi:DNA-binding FadR family transcriptional regulator